MTWTQIRRVVAALWGIANSLLRAAIVVVVGWLFIMAIFAATPNGWLTLFIIIGVTVTLCALRHRAVSRGRVLRPLGVALVLTLAVIAIIAVWAVDRGVLLGLMAMAPPLALLVLFTFLADPAIIAAIGGVKVGRSFLRLASVLVGVEVTVGGWLWLSVKGIQTDPHLLLGASIVATALVLLFLGGVRRKSKKSTAPRNERSALLGWTLLPLLLTLIVLSTALSLGGWEKAEEKAEKASPALGVPVVEEAVKERGVAPGAAYALTRGLRQTWDAAAEGIQYGNGTTATSGAPYQPPPPDAVCGEYRFLGRGDVHTVTMSRLCWSGWTHIPAGGLRYDWAAPLNKGLWVQYRGKRPVWIPPHGDLEAGVRSGVFRVAGDGSFVVTVN